MDKTRVNGGAGLKALRASRQLSQRALARSVEVSATFMGQVEKGLTAPNAALIRKIAQALQVDDDILFTLWQMIDPIITHHLLRMPTLRKALKLDDESRSSLEQAATNTLSPEQQEL